MFEGKVLVIQNGENLTIHYNLERLGKTVEELQKIGVLVNKPDAPSEIDGKSAVLKFDGDKLYYEYVGIDLTDAQRITELESALMEMTTLQAIKDMENEQAIMELIMMIGGM